jgi:hypothetical protein
MDNTPESKVIIVSRKMPLAVRISEVSKQIAEWLGSLEKPFNNETDKLQLSRYERTENGYRYRYLITNRKELSASDVNKSP